MNKNAIIQANSTYVFRIEHDDWAVLFNPSTAETYGLNPVGIFIYKLLDGKHSLSDIADLLQLSFINMPDDAESKLYSYLESLIEKGIAEYCESVCP